MSVSEELICETLYRHAFETFDVPRFSGVQHKGFYSVGVAKLSVEQGFLVLRVYNWGRITVCYTEQRGVRYSGVKRSGLSELSVISWVSAIEGVH